MTLVDVIRPARSDDLPLLPKIERAAGEAFRAIGMAPVADDPPPTVAELAAYLQTGRIWVATDDEGRLVGYVLVDVVDGCAHVEQVSVDPRHARRGFGRRMLAAVGAWARQERLPAMTLMTFTDPPWNAPYYRRLGWQEMGPTDLPPGLARVRAAEAARGLDRWPRVAMFYDLT